MDPALWELLRPGAGADSDMLEVLVRLRDPQAEIPGLRVVSRFGGIVTGRLARGDILATHALPEV